MISTPKLPPKYGYVEVEVNEKRTYKNVKTGILIDDEVTQNQPVDELLLELAADYEARLCNIELGV